MQQILLIVQILIGMGLVAVVLLQHGKGADAGAAFGGGGGGAGSVFGARGPGTLLTRVTAILAAVLFLNNLRLAYLAREQSLQNRSVMERFDAASPATSELPGDVPDSTAKEGAADVPQAALDAASADNSDVPKAPSEEKN